jgi:hypothetical protein
MRTSTQSITIMAKPDDVFEAQIGELARELVVLRAHLESNCPL